MSKGVWRLVRTPAVVLPLALVVLVMIGRRGETPDSPTPPVQIQEAAAATGDSSLSASLAAGLWWLGGSVAALLVWALLHRASFMLLIGRPVYQGFRWVSIRASWKGWMEAHGLKVKRGDNLVVPRLAHVFSGRYVDRLLVTLTPGISTDAFYRQVEGLKETLNAYDLHVQKRGPKKLRLTVYRSDTLAKPITALPIPEAAHWDRVEIGRQADGRAWRQRLLGTHLLVVGASGAGKGSVLWSIIRWLLPGVRDGSVQLWGIDPKGGVELRIGRQLFAKYVDESLAAMAALLEECVREMDRRLRSMAGIRRKHVPTPAEPLICMIIDEIASLTVLAGNSKEGKALRDRIESALGHLLTKGRAPGFVMLGFVQDPRKEVVNLRDLFGTKVALRLGNSSEVDLVLGDGMRAKGARCEEIAGDKQGTGYMVMEGSSTPMRVRAAYVEDSEITEMTSLYAPRAQSQAVVNIAN